MLSLDSHNDNDSFDGARLIKTAKISTTTKTNFKKLTQLLFPSTKMFAEVLPTPVRMGGARIASRKVLIPAAWSNTCIKLSECAPFYKMLKILNIKEIHASDSPVSTNWRTPSSTSLPTEKRERDWPWE